MKFAESENLILQCDQSYLMIWLQFCFEIFSESLFFSSATIWRIYCYFFCLFSAFVTKLLLSEEDSDDKTEAASTRSEAAADGSEKDRETYQHSHMNKTGETSVCVCRKL